MMVINYILWETCPNAGKEGTRRRRKRRRKRWWSLLVKIEEEEEEAVFISVVKQMRIRPTRIRHNTGRRRLYLFVIRSQMRIRPTRNRSDTDPNHGCDECVSL